MGDLFDEAAEAYKTLSEEQQRLSSQNWNEGPRLIRGVAGSGKTIVLANNLARRLQRSHRSKSLFEDEVRPERLLVVCNNRSLVPFLEKKIGLAYQQRTGHPLPESGLEIFSFNQLLYDLSRKGLWRYQRIEEGTDEQRAAQYLKDLEDTKRSHPEIFDAAAFDAIFVDEGQDFVEEDFRLPLDEREALDEASPIRANGVKFDPQKIDARHDAQVLRATKEAAVAVIVLGGSHDLSASVRRVSENCEYLRVTTSRFRKLHE